MSAEPASLGLSSQLVDDLEAWAEAYDATLDRQDPRASGFSSEVEHNAWVERGRELARHLKGELGPAAEVVFFEDALNQTGADRVTGKARETGQTHMAALLATPPAMDETDCLATPVDAVKGGVQAK